MRLEPPTDSWIARVVNSLQASAVRVQTPPLVSPLLQAGAAAARRTEAVAVVPGQHRSSLSHNSWRMKSGSIVWIPYCKKVRLEYK